MFWAVQGMAAELSTGAMMIDQIEASGKKISMLVANNKANFSKKATGKITFTCEDGDSINPPMPNGHDSLIFIYCS
jgi:type IV secretory pathway TrbL component